MCYFYPVKLIKSAIVLFSIAILFIGNIGVNVFKHICEEDGVTISYFMESDHGCHDEHESEEACCSEQVADNCCDVVVEHYQIKLDYVDQLHDFSYQLDFEEISTADLFSFYTEKEAIISNYPQPPPLKGKDILIRNQTFII